MRPSVIIAILSTLLVLAIAGPGLPQPAGTMARESEARQQGHRVIARPAVAEDLDLAGASYYDVFVEGVRLGQATLQVKNTGNNFILEGVGMIDSIISSLYTVRYTGHAVISPRPVQPSEAVIEEQKGVKSTKFLLKFPKANRASAVQIREKPGKKAKRTHQEFSSQSFVLDPFSTVFLIRSHDWRVGDVQVFDFLTGKKQYEMQLTCRGETTLDVDGRLLPAWEIVLQTRSHEVPRKIKLSGFVIYLSKDSRREILKVTGKHKMGRIVVDRQRSAGRGAE